MYNDGEITIFVSNIPLTAKYEDLREIFSTFGKISHLYMKNSREEKTFTGNIYVTYLSEKDGRNAIEKMNGAQYNGNILYVREANKSMSRIFHDQFGKRRTRDYRFVLHNVNNNMNIVNNAYRNRNRNDDCKDNQTEPNNDGDDNNGISNDNNDNNNQENNAEPNENNNEGNEAIPNENENDENNIESNENNNEEGKGENNDNNDNNGENNENKKNQKRSSEEIFEENKIVFSQRRNYRNFQGNHYGWGRNPSQHTRPYENPDYSSKKNMDNNDRRDHNFRYRSQKPPRYQDSDRYDNYQMRGPPPPDYIPYMYPNGEYDDQHYPPFQPYFIPVDPSMVVNQQALLQSGYQMAMVPVNFVSPDFPSPHWSSRGSRYDGDYDRDSDHSYPRRERDPEFSRSREREPAETPRNGRTPPRMRGQDESPYSPPLPRDRYERDSQYSPQKQPSPTSPPLSRNRYEREPQYSPRMQPSPTSPPFSRDRYEREPQHKPQMQPSPTSPPFSRDRYEREPQHNPQMPPEKSPRLIPPRYMNNSPPAPPKPQNSSILPQQILEEIVEYEYTEEEEDDDK